MSNGIVGAAITGSALFRRLNAHLLAPAPAPAGKVPGIAQDGGARIRQRQGDGLNKTERRFKEWHELNFPHRRLLVQAVTLKIANGCRYTPDFVAIGAGPVGLIELHAWEVKGPRAWDDAIVKLKVAAAQYPFIRFTLVSWDKKEGVWKMEYVRP